MDAEVVGRSKNLGCLLFYSSNLDFFPYKILEKDLSLPYSHLYTHMYIYIFLETKQME